jgi:hypothetical protein
MGNDDLQQIQRRLKATEDGLEAKTNEREKVRKTLATKEKRNPDDEARAEKLEREIKALQNEQRDLTARIKDLRKRHGELSDAEKKAERDKLLTDYTPEAFDTCPVSHVVALVLDDCRDHGIGFAVISGDRRDGIAQRYGHSSQAQAYYGHLNGDPNYPYPANPPGHSTHEYRRGASGYPFPPGADGSQIDASKLGLDLRSNAEASAFCAEAKKIGYDVWQPYNTGTELHHVVIRSNPVPNLVKRGRV